MKYIAAMMLIASIGYSQKQPLEVFLPAVQHNHCQSETWGNDLHPNIKGLNGSFNGINGVGTTTSSYNVNGFDMMVFDAGQKVGVVWLTRLGNDYAGSSITVSFHYTGYLPAPGMANMHAGLLAVGAGDNYQDQPSWSVFPIGVSGNAEQVHYQEIEFSGNYDPGDVVAVYLIREGDQADSYQYSILVADITICYNIL